MALDGIWWSLFIVFQASSVLLLRWWQAAAKSVGLLDGWMDGLLGWWHETNVMKWIIPGKNPDLLSAPVSRLRMFSFLNLKWFFTATAAGSRERPWEDPGRTLGIWWDGHGQWSSIPCMGSHGLFKKGHWINGAKKLMPSLCQAYAKLLRFISRRSF